MPGDAPLRNVTVEGIRLRFAAAHMATLGGELEPLHGHNYEVHCRVEGDLTDDRWVIDFGVLKRVLREACEALEAALVREPPTSVAPLCRTWSPPASLGVCRLAYLLVLPYNKG